MLDTFFTMLLALRILIDKISEQQTAAYKSVQYYIKSSICDSEYKLLSIKSIAWVNIFATEIYDQVKCYIPESTIEALLELGYF